MNALRDAFYKVANDPEVKEETKKNMLEIGYVPPEEYLKALDFVLSQPEDTIKEFSKYIKF